MNKINITALENRKNRQDFNTNTEKIETKQNDETELKTQELNYDLNNDGKIDDEDFSIAAKVLGGKRKFKKNNKE